MSSYCTNYFDNPKMAHPSLPNYLWLEAGDNFGILDDNPPSQDHQSTTSHLVTLLEAAGVSWKAYEEDISGTTCPIADVNNYAVRHDPFVYFDDVSGNPPNTTAARCIAHVRPFTELATDLNSGTVTGYNFITPNVCDDMHDNCTGDPIKQGDDWLKANIPTILASSAYKNGGAVFVTWDESESSTDVPIGMIVLSPFAKGGGATSTTKYYHSSMLRTAEEIFGVTPFLRDAANQSDLAALFSTFP
jgi:phospholipase C